MFVFEGRKRGPLLSVLPILVVPGLGLLGLFSGAGHPGQALRQAVLTHARQDAPLPTDPLIERVAYTREMHREDLRTFQAKIDYWQSAVHTPGPAGQQARRKVAQWQRLFGQSERALNGLQTR